MALQADDEWDGDGVVVFDDQELHAITATTLSPRLPVIIVEAQGESRAGRDGAAGMAKQFARDGAIVDDWVAPIVEFDPFWEQLGADSVADAGDWVHF